MFSCEFCEIIKDIIFSQNDPGGYFWLIHL